MRLSLGPRQFCRRFRSSGDTSGDAMVTQVGTQVGTQFCRRFSADELCHRCVTYVAIATPIASPLVINCVTTCVTTCVTIASPLVSPSHRPFVLDDGVTSAARLCCNRFFTAVSPLVTAKSPPHHHLSVTTVSLRSHHLSVTTAILLCHHTLLCHHCVSTISPLYHHCHHCQNFFITTASLPFLALLADAVDIFGTSGTFGQWVVVCISTASPLVSPQGVTTCVTTGGHHLSPQGVTTFVTTGGHHLCHHRGVTTCAMMISQLYDISTPPPRHLCVTTASPLVRHHCFSTA